jgi:hypothetical protein
MIYEILIFLNFLCSSLATTTLTLDETYTINQHILDDYKVNSNGYITLIKITQDTFDRLILIEGKKGKVHYKKKNGKIINPHIQLKKGILDHIIQLKGHTEKQHYKGFRLSFQKDTNSAKAVFEFLADHTSVEWSLLTFSIKDQTRSFVYTSYRPDLEFFGSVKVHRLLSHPQTVRTLKHYHNHPRSPIEAVGKYAFPSNADLDFRNKILAKGIQLVEFMIRTDGFYVNYTSPQEWNKRNGEDWL